MMNQDPTPPVPPVFGPSPDPLSSSNFSVNQFMSMLATFMANASVNATATPSNSATSSLPKGVKPPVLETFSGKSPKDVRPWLQRARSVLRISGFDLESSDVVSYAASFLTGAANSWFLSEADRAPYGSIDNGGFNNFDEFATALTRHMGDPNPEDKARKSLRSLRQTTSVKSYADEFQRLITYLPNRDPADLCFDFVTGLKPKIQELLVGKVTCDMKWQDVRDLAYRFDDVVMMNHRSFPSPPPPFYCP